MLNKTSAIEQYISAHSDEESDLLHEVSRQAHIKLVAPQMISGHIQGRLLSMISKMIAPKCILELGTFAGYSALCLAEGLQEDGKLYTIDINDEIEDFTRPLIEQSELANKIDFLIGDALELIPRINDEFDLVFIDANKRDYIAYYESVLPKVPKGGFILADNTLWDGKVLEVERHTDAQSQAICAFNDLIAKDERIEKVILPIRDGLTLIRKK